MNATMAQGGAAEENEYARDEGYRACKVAVRAITKDEKTNSRPAEPDDTIPKISTG